MDFLDMDFSLLFKEKHGNEIFDKICMIIKQENPIKYSECYIASIFKLTFLDFWGLTSKQIKGLLEDLQPNYKVNVDELKNIHATSIMEIKKCLESVMPK